LSKKSASQLVLQAIGGIGMVISAGIFLLYISFMFSNRYSTANLAYIISSGILLFTTLTLFIANYLVFLSGRDGRYIIPVRIMSVIALVALTPIPLIFLPKHIADNIPAIFLNIGSNYFLAFGIWLVPAIILIALYRVKKQGIGRDRYRVIQRDEIMSKINSGNKSSKSDVALNVFRFIVIVLLINVVINLILKANGANVSSFFLLI